MSRVLATMKDLVFVRKQHYLFNRLSHIIFLLYMDDLNVVFFLCRSRLNGKIKTYSAVDWTDVGKRSLFEEEKNPRNILRVSCGSQIDKSLFPEQKKPSSLRIYCKLYISLQAYYCIVIARRACAKVIYVKATF